MSQLLRCCHNIYILFVVHTIQIFYFLIFKISKLLDIWQKINCYPICFKFICIKALIWRVVLDTEVSKDHQTIGGL